MKRAAVALLATAFFACGKPSPPEALPPPSSIVIEPPRGEAPPPGRPGESKVDAEAERRLKAALDLVARVRGLPAKTPVNLQVLERGPLLDRVREHVAAEVPPEVIDAQGHVLLSLGLVPLDFDYRAAVFDLLESQLAGFYDPRGKSMYLARDLAPAAEHATLAHELVHALQDQYWDLGSRLEYRPGQGDAQSALHALAEGDATSAMLEIPLVGLERSALDVPESALSLEMELTMATDERAMTVPRVLRASLVAPYIDGLRFVHALRRRGGWAAVDAAWKAPPTTTEQLLHLEKYDASEPALELPPPTPPDEGWEVVYDDSLGEQGLRIVLEEWAPKRVAARAAEGWGGDRITLFRRRGDYGETYALSWLLRFDEGPRNRRDGEAREAFEVLVRAAGDSGQGGAVCADRRELGAIAVVREGRGIAIAAGPYRHTGRGFEAQGECPAALRWATHLAKAVQ